MAKSTTEDKAHSTEEFKESAHAGGIEMNSHFLAFGIGERKLAFPLKSVERVIRMVALVPVPEGPEWISGLLNLHGRVLPVIDLRKRLGLPQREVHPDDRIIIIQSENLKLGVVAETVEDVTDVSEKQLSKPEGTLKKASLLRAVIQKKNDMYLVLNVDAIDSEMVIDIEKAGLNERVEA